MQTWWYEVFSRNSPMSRALLPSTEPRNLSCTQETTVQVLATMTVTWVDSSLSRPESSFPKAGSQSNETRVQDQDSTLPDCIQSPPGLRMYRRVALTGLWRGGRQLAFLCAGKHIRTEVGDRASRGRSFSTAPRQLQFFTVGEMVEVVWRHGLGLPFIWQRIHCQSGIFLG